MMKKATDKKPNLVTSLIEITIKKYKKSTQNIDMDFLTLFSLSFC